LMKIDPHQRKLVGVFRFRPEFPPAASARMLLN
jgi:hypothetical protein